MEVPELDVVGWHVETEVKTGFQWRDRTNTYMDSQEGSGTHEQPVAKAPLVGTTRGGLCEALYYHPEVVEAGDEFVQRFRILLSV